MCRHLFMNNMIQLKMKINANSTALSSLSFSLMRLANRKTVSLTQYKLSAVPVRNVTGNHEAYHQLHHILYSNFAKI